MFSFNEIFLRHSSNTKYISKLAYKFPSLICIVEMSAIIRSPSIVQIKRNK